ncbi:unnamed protein product, partial [Mesorhabditis spiculigera]
MVDVEAGKKEKGRFIPELQLSVTKFNDSEEQMKLMMCEEMPSGYMENEEFETEYYPSQEEIYEFVCLHRIWRCPRASLLAFSLLLGLALGIVVLVVVMICTFLSLSKEKPSGREDVLGVISWLHYPVGDIAIRRANHTMSAYQHLNNFHY